MFRGDQTGVLRIEVSSPNRGGLVTQVSTIGTTGFFTTIIIDITIVAALLEIAVWVIVQAL